MHLLVPRVNILFSSIHKLIVCILFAAGKSLYRLPSFLSVDIHNVLTSIPN
jgi:hypothetical protein